MAAPNKTDTDPPTAAATANATPGPAPTSLQRLIDAPKGHVDHVTGEAFLLHVIWETPSVATATELLSALRQCAVATHRDTPCVPTYLFRISNNDQDLCPPPPATIGEHPQLREAQKKVRMGVPAGAVRADLARRGINPDLVDADPSAELPAELCRQPVTCEFVEVYLDERAFMEHVGSRDYLDAYGVVMKPSLQNRPPRTTRLGTPIQSLVEKILEPILHETVAPLHPGCTVWQTPKVRTTAHDAVFLSLDVAETPTSLNHPPNSDNTNSDTGDLSEKVAAALPTAFLDYSTTCVAFAHPVRPRSTRVLCVLAALPPLSVLKELSAALPLVRGEAHVMGGGEAAAEVVRVALVAAGLGFVTVNASVAVGHALHDRAGEIVAAPRTASSV